MRVVVDSGVIYECVRMSRTVPLEDQHTIALAFFELGNVIWKSSILMKVYDQKEAYQLLSGCELVLEKMYMEHSNLEDIYQVSAQHRITFYDAAYVCLAQKLDVPLVTLDQKLFEKTRSFVQTLPFEKFIK